ncbi:MAG: hypothetical protein ACI9DJ_000681 [Algoriphagus sp.]|jgi:hypothetical protein
MRVKFKSNLKVQRLVIRISRLGPSRLSQPNTLRSYSLPSPIAEFKGVSSWTEKTENFF